LHTSVFLRAEKRLGARFPESCKEVFQTQRWATGLARWELHEPGRCEWLADSRGSRAETTAARAAERRVLLIASDVGGDGLALQRQRADDAQLAETVYRFDHDSGRIEQQANALLEAADEADKERRRQERASLDQRIVERVTALGGDEKAAARELELSRARVRGALRRLGAARPPG
jgi:hypothetical protein